MALVVKSGISHCHCMSPLTWRIVSQRTESCVQGPVSQSCHRRYRSARVCVFYERLCHQFVLSYCFWLPSSFMLRSALRFKSFVLHFFLLLTVFSQNSPAFCRFLVYRFRVLAFAFCPSIFTLRCRRSATTTALAICLFAPPTPFLVLKLEQSLL